MVPRLLLKRVLYLKTQPVKSSVAVQGIGMTSVHTPLHNIYVRSTLVTGFCRVDVVPALPIKGVDLILGNDLAGGQVLPVPEVLDMPNSSLESEHQMSSDIFPACVVTRAKSNKYGLDLSGSFIATEKFPEINFDDKSENKSFLPHPEISLPASREKFIAAQKLDASLSKSYCNILLQEEAKGRKVAYIVVEGLLLRPLGW